MSREIVQNLTFRKAQSLDGTKLAGAIEKAYLSQRRGDHFTTKKSFSPSNIGYGKGTCARYWYLAFDGAEFVETTDAVGIANMSNGLAAHERLQKLFEDSPEFADVEIETELVLSDPPVRGFIDVIFTYQGTRVVGEIKTTNQMAFDIRKNSMKPAYYHLFQILIYMYGTGIDQGAVIYENKNDQSLLVIPVQMNARNKKILEDAFSWLRRVRKTWEDKELPKHPWTRKNQNCRQCPLFSKCWDESPEGTIKIEPMEKPKLS